MKTFSQSELQISGTEGGSGRSLYLGNLRSCLGVDSLESNATHSSEEDRESEIEDEKECAISKGFMASTGNHMKMMERQRIGENG